MKIKALAPIALFCLFALCETTALAVTPVEENDPNLAMYATDFAAGAVQPVNIDPYTAGTHPARLNPANVLGTYDATQNPPVAGEAYNPNEKFFALAARDWTEYTLGPDPADTDPVPFMNVNGYPDIRFAEVTWGSWHTEAALVYLTEAYIRDENGDVVPYGSADDGIGYYAGIVWNKMGITGVTAERRMEITQSYLEGARDFAANTFSQDGNFGISEFYLPNEVVYATGIRLVDITADVYEEYNPATFLNVGGANNGTLVTLNEPYDTPITAANVTAVYGTDGNTDGYDLDAIRVYRYVPGGDDTATGLGEAILEKGTWFMYNVFDELDGETGPYDIVAGNPKNGANKIGSYSITSNGDGTYTVHYQIDPSITVNGLTYEIVVVDAHLAISDFMEFTASPGTDDNQDFDVPFADDDGEFFIFAHFAVEYR